MIRIARNLYKKLVDKDSPAYNELLDKYFLSDEAVGVNNTPFALCVYEIEDLEVGRSLKVDLKTLEEYIIIDIPDLKYYKYPIIICKRIDSKKAVDVGQFEEGKKLIPCINFIFDGTDFSDWKVDLNNYGNSLSEIKEYTKTLI